MSAKLDDFTHILFSKDFKTPDELFKLAPGFKNYFAVIEEADLRTGDKKEPILDLDKTIRYIILMFKEGTDLFKEYPDDYNLRKEAAASKAGFKRLRDEEWPDFLNKIMRYENTHVNKWIHHYLQIQKKPIWREIQYLSIEIDKLYLERIKQLESGFSEKAKVNFLEEIELRKNRLELEVKKYYSGNEDFKKVDSLLILPITPENVFDQLQVPEEYYRIRQISDLKDVPKDSQ